MNFGKTCRLIFAACAISAAANAATVFNFDADNLGKATGFTDTVDGISATFSSPGDPGGFGVYSSIFQTLTGNVLGDPGPAFLDNLSLSVSFNQNLSAVALNFATSDFGTPSPFTLTAYENASLVGTAHATGSALAGFGFPEGEIAFQGPAFNRIVLSSTATDFAVDNIAVAKTPEPAPAVLLVIGLLAIGVSSIRQHKNN